MTPNEALDIIAGLLARIVPTDENTATTNEAWEALSALRAVVEEQDALKAELELSDKSWDIKQKQLEEARAELEAARPLLKEIEEADESELDLTLQSMRVWEAALAYREKKVKP